MTLIVNFLAGMLPTIRRHGDFYATGTATIFMPGVEVEGVGRISLPLLPGQAEQLIAVAERAPYGRGEETIVDTDVRRTWQIASERVRLHGRDWQRTLDQIVARAAAGLGVTAPVAAQLYKLLVYDAGSFFVEHRDTEKAPGMFATLVIVLPSEYSGGQLMVRHRGREVSLDLCTAEPSEISFAAFYADCVHEMRPVTSGCRLTLVYNLVRHGRNEQPPAYDAERSRIAEALRRWAAGEEGPTKLIYPLEHAYTAAELGFEALKNADAAVAAVLIEAAADAGCDIHLALVSIEESGSAEYCDYRPRGRRHWQKDEEEFEIGEVFERIATISEWRRPDGSCPQIDALPFEDDELCPADAFQGMQPDEQYFQEAAGNEGASFERTYRRAALVLWPRSRMVSILSRAGLSVSLPYLKQLAQRWVESGEDAASSLWQEAHALSACIMDAWPAPQWNGSSGLEATMLDSLAQLQDAARIDSFLANISAAGTYGGANIGGNENEAMERAAALLPAPRSAVLMEQIVAANAVRQPSACANLLARLAVATSFASCASLLLPAATALVETLVGERVDPNPPAYWQLKPSMTPDFIVDLLDALCRIGAIALADRAVDHVLADPDVFGMDAVLVPAALHLPERMTNPDCVPVRRLRAACLEHLRARIAQPLEPPPDFTRASDIACRCAHCAELSRFLADATCEVWTFKAAESLRQHVERSIRTHDCDLDCTTEKRSRPYTLVCVKNQASYERRTRQRKKDLEDLAQLSNR
jgi:predicted 2-oxoglutarate/Fe(II)-dependent dioxygenase YbiX